MALITEEEAWQLVVKHAGTLPTRTVDLKNAIGYCPANPVLCDRDIPPCNRSAMDGYAVRAEDIVNAPVALKVVGEVAAGSAEQPRINSGECVRIFTGAVVPPTADTVVMQEDAEIIDEQTVKFCRAVATGSHIFMQGENARKDDVLVAPGRPLNAVRIGICASVGVSQIKVYRRPVVAILVTGDEITAGKCDIDKHQTRDSNGPMISSLLEMSKVENYTSQHVPDDYGSLVEAVISTQRKADITLLSGGVSVGKYDLVAGAVKEAGGEIIFHGIRIKPGKPQLMALMPDNKYVFGLPGNPLSVMTGMQEFVLPLIKMLSGYKPEYARLHQRYKLAADVSAIGRRQQYLLAKYCIHNGQTCVAPIEHSGSADLIAANEADGTIIVPVGTKHIPAGEIVDFHPWESLL